MTKRYYRFFGPLLNAQEIWLNKMSAQGYRLLRTEKLLYEFETCRPGQFQYCVEFIGQKSKENAAQYRNFLEDMGYQVHYKNINLNYSMWKVHLRPWAEKGGRLATSFTTFNRELLIVEKENDGKPFSLHTTFEDRLAYYRSLRSPWLFLFIAFAALGICTRALTRGSAVWGIFAVIALIPLLLYQAEIARLKKQGNIRE